MGLPRDAALRATKLYLKFSQRAHTIRGRVISTNYVPNVVLVGRRRPQKGTVICPGYFAKTVDGVDTKTGYVELSKSAKDVVIAERVRPTKGIVTKKRVEGGSTARTNKANGI